MGVAIFMVLSGADAAGLVAAEAAGLALAPPLAAAEAAGLAADGMARLLAGADGAAAGVLPQATSSTARPRMARGFMNGSFSGGASCLWTAAGSQAVQD